jgi:hypothetical protein
MNTCPNAKLSMHSPKLQLNRVGECKDCGRKIGTGRVRPHYNSNGRAAYRTLVQYEGYPID